MTSCSILCHDRFRSTSVSTSNSLLTKECVDRHFAKLETDVTMPKVKLSSATKIKAIRKYFDEFTATSNDKLYYQVSCCIVKHEERFFVEQHAATGKHQKGIEKRNIFV